MERVLLRGGLSCIRLQSGPVGEIALERATWLPAEFGGESFATVLRGSQSFASRSPVCFSGSQLAMMAASRFDADGDGSLSFEEFVKFQTALYKPTTRQQPETAPFKANEFKHFLRSTLRCKEQDEHDYRLPLQFIGPCIRELARSRGGVLADQVATLACRLFVLEHGAPTQAFAKVSVYDGGMAEVRHSL